MSVSETLTFQYHQQDTDYYCGAACAQMVLETMGAGILDQDDLYADNHAHSTIDAGVNWATGPDGLEWTLNSRCPPALTESLMLCALGSKNVISRKICWTIHQHKVAPIALVHGWKHWIVVSGYTTSAHPTASNDNSYAIEAFDLKDPGPPPLASAPPLQHNAADACGTADGRGLGTQHIAYSEWKSTYMTGVPGGHWNGKFIAFCDPEPPASPGGPPGLATMRRPGGDLLPANVAAELAVAGLNEYGLFERKDWKRALRDARPAGAVLVRRLDHLDSYYWLVQLQAQRGTVAVASVDGRSGQYLQAVLLPKPRRDFMSIGREDALKLVVGRRIELGNDRGRLLVRAQALSMYPHLVWRPCRESLSPYYPFYMVTVGNHRLYVRVDGVTFASLTLDQMGI